MYWRVALNAGVIDIPTFNKHAANLQKIFNFDIEDRSVATKQKQLKRWVKGFGQCSEILSECICDPVSDADAEHTRQFQMRMPDYCDARPLCVAVKITQADQNIADGKHFNDGVLVQGFSLITGYTSIGKKMLASKTNKAKNCDKFTALADAYTRKAIACFRFVIVTYGKKVTTYDGRRAMQDCYKVVYT